VRRWPFKESWFRHNACRIFCTQDCGHFCNVHSQIRITRQPAARSVRVTRRSRRRLSYIFCCQEMALRFGLRFLPQSWPCQKQPSTNTTSFAFGKTKSGLPGSRKLRRHPRRPAKRMRRRSFNSVLAFPLLRIRDINVERDKPPNVVVSRWALPGQRITMLEHFGQCFANGLSE
jgi:hypothetical protein